MTVLARRLSIAGTAIDSTLLTRARPLLSEVERSKPPPHDR